MVTPSARGGGRGGRDTEHERCPRHRRRGLGRGRPPAPQAGDAARGRVDDTVGRGVAPRLGPHGRLRRRRTGAPVPRRRAAHDQHRRDLDRRRARHHPRRPGSGGQRAGGAGPATGRGPRGGGARGRDRGLRRGDGQLDGALEGVPPMGPPAPRTSPPRSTRPGICATSSRRRSVATSTSTPPPRSTRSARSGRPTSAASSSWPPAAIRPGTGDGAPERSPTDASATVAVRRRRSRSPTAPRGAQPSSVQPRRAQSSSAAFRAAPTRAGTVHAASGRWCSLAQATVRGSLPASSRRSPPISSWCR
jgi:hypothetical protein